MRLALLTVPAECSRGAQGSARPSVGEPSGLTMNINRKITSPSISYNCTKDVLMALAGTPQGTTEFQRKLKLGYAIDPWFQVSNGNHNKLISKDGLYYHRSDKPAVVVPNVKELKDTILAGSS